MNERVAEAIDRARRGGAPKYHQKLAEQGKLFVRERLRLLLDDADRFVEDGVLVSALAGDLPADAVITGVGDVHGRPVAVMANDPTVKAGSWGPHTVEKIIRIIELARKREIPILYLVDSAGARIDRQVEMFPGRRGGGTIGVVANQPMHKGGVLFVDSSDKVARFVWLCDAFNVPLIFLADVPGFMIGSAVERQGIIRHGAKLITAVSEATVPKFCVVVRKSYGAGLYAMAGPGFEPDATIALPTARIAVMGPEPAVNAVFFNRIQALSDPEERARFIEEKRREYEEDIDLLHLASENVVDAVVQADDLREELIRRLAHAGAKDRHFSERRHGVPPV